MSHQNFILIQMRLRFAIDQLKQIKALAIKSQFDYEMMADLSSSIADLSRELRREIDAYKLHIVKET